MSISGVSSGDGAYKFPVHIARAYNVAQPRPVHAGSPAQPTSASTPMRGTADHVSAATSQRVIDHLVAGKVSPSAAPWTVDASARQRPVTLSQASGGNDGGAIPLYRRAADRVEAAVGVALGKALDVKG